MNYGKLTAGTTKTAIDTAKPSEKGEIITYLSRMGDVLDDIGKGHRKLTACFYGVGIKTIIDSNETDTEERTDFFKELTGLDIVTPKSGKVFYYDAVNLFCLNCFHQLLPFRTVKIRSSVAIVNKGSCQFQIRTIAYILIEQYQLIFDGIRAIQIIFTRKTSVDSSLVNDNKLFRSSGLTGQCLLTAL